jgi:hypothetical protein
MLPRHTTTTNTTKTAKTTNDEDDVDDEDAGDDDDDTPTLELGEEGQPRRNKPTLSHDAAVSTDRVLAEPTMPKIVPKSPSRHCLN